MNDGDNDPSRASARHESAKRHLADVEHEIAVAAIAAQQLPDLDLITRYRSAVREHDEAWAAVKKEMDDRLAWIEDRYGDKPYH